MVPDYHTPTNRTIRLRSYMRRPSPGRFCPAEAVKELAEVSKLEITHASASNHQLPLSAICNFLFFHSFAATKRACCLPVSFKPQRGFVTKPRVASSVATLGRNQRLLQPRRLWSSSRSFNPKRNAPPTFVEKTMWDINADNDCGIRLPRFFGTAQLLQSWWSATEITQGSECLATLGFVAESFQDSRNVTKCGSSNG